MGMYKRLNLLLAVVLLFRVTSRARLLGGVSILLDSSVLKPKRALGYVESTNVSTQLYAVRRLTTEGRGKKPLQQLSGLPSYHEAKEDVMPVELINNAVIKLPDSSRYRYLPDGSHIYFTNKDLALGEIADASFTTEQNGNPEETDDGIICGSQVRERGIISHQTTLDEALVVGEGDRGNAVKLMPEDRSAAYLAAASSGQLKNHRNRRQRKEVGHNVAEIIQDAFKSEAIPEKLCAMAYKEDTKEQLVSNLLSLLTARKRRRKNPQHVLYICRNSSDVVAFTEKYSEQLSKLGNVNIICGNSVMVTSNSLLTIADEWSLFKVYNILNDNRTKKISDILLALRGSNSEVNNEATCDNLDIESICNEQEQQSVNLKYDKDIVTEQNQEEFTNVLRSLIDSFMLSHDDIIQEEWTDDVTFEVPKEAVMPMHMWLKSHYHSPEQVVGRLKLDDPGKRIVVMDGFKNVSSVNNNLKTSFFDEILLTLKKDCQLLVLAPKLFSPQSVSQWLSKLKFNMQFVTAARMPNFTVCYRSRHFDPFENGRDPVYSHDYVSSLRELLSSDSGDPASFFNVNTDRTGCVSNIPWNVEMKEVIKDVIKEALEMQSIDTLRKLRHLSRDTYDYIKKYIQGHPSYRGNAFAWSDRESKDVDKLDGNIHGDSATLDSVLDNVINLERFHLGGKLIRKCIKKSTMVSMMQNHVEHVVARVIDDGIFPAIIYTQNSNALTRYAEVLQGKFEVSEEIKDLIKKSGLEAVAPTSIYEGVFVSLQQRNPDLTTLVRDNMHLFKVVVACEEMPKARHHVLFGTLFRRGKLSRNRLMSNVQQVNMWLGSEKVTFYGVYPMHMLHSLNSMLVHPEVEFRTYNPYQELAMKRSMMSRHVKNPQLLDKLAKMTFDRYIIDCRNRYMISATYTENNPQHIVKVMESGIFQHKPVERAIDEGKHPKGVSREYTIKERDETYPLYDNTAMSHESKDTAYKSTALKQHHQTMESAHFIRTRLDRHDYLKLLEGKLLTATVDIKPFYILDQRIVKARRFDQYIRASIRGSLLFKGKYIGTVADAVPLSGADVIGCDGNRYTVVWIGDKDCPVMATDEVAEDIRAEIGEMTSTKGIAYVAILKRGDTLLCVPAYFIKDIESLGKSVTESTAPMSRFSKGNVSIVLNSGIPSNAMPNIMPYFIMTSGTSPETYMLPEKMEAFDLLSEYGISLVQVSKETWEQYRAREKELMEGAIEKILTCSETGIRTVQQAIRLINETREVHKNRSLGGLEPHLRQRQAMNKSWGYSGTAEPEKSRQ